MFNFHDIYDRVPRTFPGRRPAAQRQPVNPLGVPTYTQAPPAYSRNPYYAQPQYAPVQPQYTQRPVQQQQYQPQQLYPEQEMDEYDNDIFNLYGRKRQAPKQHRQQAQEQPTPVKRQPVQPRKKVNLNKTALKIQRLWRGWNVRKYDLIVKLRAIKRIDDDVDELLFLNQQFLHPTSITEVPSDVSVTNKVPRPLLQFEHELTTKLLSTDEISGRMEIIRTSRKELVNKIEGILEQVDSAKTFFQNNPQLTEKPQQQTTTSPQHRHQTAEEVSLLSSSDDEDEGEADTTGNNSDDNLEPIIEDISSRMKINSDKDTITSPALSTTEVLPLKTMCFNVCDRIMKQAM